MAFARFPEHPQVKVDTVTEKLLIREGVTNLGPLETVNGWNFTYKDLELYPDMENSNTS